MLELARHKRDSVGLTDRQLRLVHCDALKLKLNDRFDWVCILFNTFLAFPSVHSQRKLLRVVHAHLKPGGRFWLDIFNPDLSILSSPSSHGHEPHTFYVPELDRTVFSTTDIDRDAAMQTQRVTFNYSWFDKFGRTHKDTLRFEMTWVYPRELVLLLEANGFAIERLYGNHDGGAIKDGCPRMIACCRKK
jgi:SAM-dependent methyltransferase